jgi:cytochrome c
MRLIAVVAVLFTCVGVVRAQNPEPRIWQGVYTTAQADRGQTSFNSSCLRCHGDKLQGNTAPALSGDRFFTTWGSEPIASLFAKIRDTMPPNFGTSIDDQVKLDIVAYILRTKRLSGRSE